MLGGDDPTANLEVGEREGGMSLLEGKGRERGRESTSEYLISRRLDRARVRGGDGEVFYTGRKPSFLVVTETSPKDDNLVRRRCFHASSRSLASREGGPSNKP